jgi:glycosyltransferase involved in cell wall biosynthesis
MSLLRRSRIIDEKGISQFQLFQRPPRQTLRPTQVIVVDNASRDGRTKEAALAARVDYVREDHPGLDIARNTGAKQATGEIVAYTDDDVVLHPRWLERMVAAFVTPAVAAVTGLLLPAELETEPQRFFETYWGFGRGYRPIAFGGEFFASDRAYGCPAWEIGAGASMAFRREIFAKADFFDERLDVGAGGCSGDSEYWHRVLSSGGVCRYEPAAVAFDYHRRDAAGLSKQIYYYMRGHAAALLVRYERSGNIGNLRRALISMPRWYTVRVASGSSDGDPSGTASSFAKWLAISRASPITCASRGRTRLAAAYEAVDCCHHSRAQRRSHLGGCPRPSVRVTRGAGSGQHLASVLQEGRENASIDACLGFIWRISVNYVPCRC